jgi:hypothetical protein
MVLEKMTVNTNELVREGVVEAKRKPFNMQSRFRRFPEGLI